MPDRLLQSLHQPEKGFSRRFRIADYPDNTCRLRIVFPVSGLKHMATYGILGFVRHPRHPSVHDRIAKGTLRCHAVDDIHIGGFAVRSRQVQCPATRRIEQVGTPYEVQKLPALRFIAVQQSPDKIRRLLVADKLCSGFRHAHQGIDRPFPPGILPADDIPDMQPLCFLRVGVDTDLVF